MNTSFLIFDHILTCLSNGSVIVPMSGKQKVMEKSARWMKTWVLYEAQLPGVELYGHKPDLFRQQFF